MTCNIFIDYVRSFNFEITISFEISGGGADCFILFYFQIIWDSPVLLDHFQTVVRLLVPAQVHQKKRKRKTKVKKTKYKLMMQLAKYVIKSQKK